VHNVNIRSCFNAIKITKTGQEITRKAEERVIGLDTKIHEREERIKRIKTEYNIEDKDLLQALANANQTYSNAQLSGGDGAQKFIPAGVVQNIQTENSLIVAEKEQIEVLSLLARNLDPVEKYSLTFDELKLLSF
jgi:phage-related protein